MIEWIADGAAVLTLPGTKKLNIVGGASIAAGRDALAELAPRAAAGELRALVLRGPGASFVGGADIAEMAGLTPATAPAFIRALGGLCEAVRRFPCPTIARLSGYVLGGGLEVAAAADIRISTRSAVYGMPETKVGIPSVIHAALLPRLVGRSRAAWLLLTGENIDAATAERWAFVHELVGAGAVVATHGDAADEAALDAAVQARALALAAMGPAVLRQQKRMLRQWEAQSADAAIEASVAEFASAFATGEPQRHMGEFLARKRKPSN